MVFDIAFLFSWNELHISILGMSFRGLGLFIASVRLILLIFILSPVWKNPDSTSSWLPS